VSHSAWNIRISVRFSAQDEPQQGVPRTYLYSLLTHNISKDLSFTWHEFLVSTTTKINCRFTQGRHPLSRPLNVVSPYRLACGREE